MGAVPACLTIVIPQMIYLLRPLGCLVGNDLSEEIVRKRELAAAAAERAAEGRGGGGGEEERLGTYNIGRMKWKER